MILPTFDSYIRGGMTQAYIIEKSSILSVHGGIVVTGLMSVFTLLVSIKVSHLTIRINA